MSDSVVQRLHTSEEHMTDSQQLLRDYIESNSETAFRELVGRYIDLVYSTALRRTDYDTRFAEDIAQTVFTDLSKKAPTLPPGVMLGGWLHQHTTFVASNVLRSEKRRVAREQQAIEMNLLHEDHDQNWKDLAPVLDDAIQELAPSERDAVVLRFFEKRDFRSVGIALGVSDDTAQKRVSRALEKLRELLVQRGVTLGAVALGVALTNRSIEAAPAQLSNTIANSLSHSKSIASKSSPFRKLAAMSAVVAVLLICALNPDALGKFRSWFGPHQKPEGSATARAPKAESLAKEAGDAPVPTSGIETTNAQDSKAPLSPALTNVLRLTIVAADSGKPVPNVPVEIRFLADDKWTEPKAASDRMGICEIPFAENVSQMQVTTRIEGFADTRLLWNVERGQKIPSAYSLRLIRPVAIGGRVLDSQGSPIAGAKVSWNHEQDPIRNFQVESHAFNWIAVRTDADGRWQSKRIAPEMIQDLYGSADHPDYEHASLFSVQNDPEAGTQLQTGTHIFKLNQAAVITGLVLDPDGNPVPEAKVLCGVRGMGDSRSSKTLEDGTFVIKGVKLGKTMLSAEAKGFAAATIAITVTTNKSSFTVKLDRGKTLRIRVLNQKGAPVQGAKVILQTSAYTSNDAAPLVQAAFNQKTDESGRIVWEEAPDQELFFTISAANYMEPERVKVRPTETEHVITLNPALVVSGTVRDAHTSKDIPKFRIMCGWPAQGEPHWSTLERNWLAFAGGKFRHTFDEALIVGMKNPGYILKFEAEGYAPFTSRTIQPDEGSVTLDVLLTPATSLITVLLPDGRPATQTEVGFVSPDARLQIKSGRFNRNNLPRESAYSMTDSRGQFQMPQEQGVSHIVLLHQQGCAVITLEDLLIDSTVHLQPWGRLEGTYRRGSKPVADREFTLELGFAKPDAISVSFTPGVKSDASGKFTFSQLLPGTYQLVMLAPYQQDGGTTTARQKMQEVEIQSGKTTRVATGGNAYVIRARLRLPEGFDGTQINGMVRTKSGSPPSSIMTDPKAMEEWMRRPDVQEQMKQARDFPLIKQPDGTFAAEDVPAGDYFVRVVAHNQSKQGVPPTAFWIGDSQATVPSEPATGTIDLGEIVMKAIDPKQLQRR